MDFVVFQGKIDVSLLIPLSGLKLINNVVVLNSKTAKTTESVVFRF